MVSQREIDNAILGAHALAALFEKHGPETTQEGADSETPETAGYFSLLDEACLHGFSKLGEGCFSAVFAHPKFPSLVVKLSIKGREDSAAAYLAYARAHPNPHLPRVHYIQRYDTGCYVAVLDRLERVGAADYAHMYNDDGNSLSLAYQEITKFFEGVASIDIHRDNVMSTEDGTIVITDPLSFSRGQSRVLRTGIERGLGLTEVSRKQAA